MKHLRCVAAFLLLTTVAALAQAETPAAPAPGGVILGGTLFDIFDRGGICMWPILLCSILTVAFALERAIALRASAIYPRRLFDSAQENVRAGRLDEAAKLCAASRAPFARMLAACLAHAHSGILEIEAALEAAGSRELYDLRRNVRPLSTLADVATLLGLTGTVLGMIKAFEVVARTGALGRTELLAEGIGEALITTAFGLFVAVPALVAYHYFRSKADDILRTMEDGCLSIVGIIHERSKAGPGAGSGGSGS